MWIFSFSCYGCAHCNVLCLFYCDLQNKSVLMRMGKFTGITCACAIPPAQKDYVPIAKMPKITDQVVIGTSGTLMKWINHKKILTNDIKILVFDEADHMLAEVWMSSIAVPLSKTCVCPLPNVVFYYLFCY